MAKLGSVPQHSTNGQSNVVVSLCSLGVILGMVIAILGIKLRWFKKRIHFDQLPSGSTGSSSENNQIILRRSSRNFQEHFCEPVVAQGIFRKRLDEDVIVERPKTLPPVRIRKSSKTSVIFGPPKRNEVPVTVVEEPVVIPPPPPPLPPSASTLSLAALNGSAARESKEEKVDAKASNGSAAREPQEELIEDKVNFAPSVEIIPNGNSSTEIVPLNTEEAPISRQLSGRKQTGYTRPSDDIIAELQKLSDEVSKGETFNNEPLQPEPRISNSSGKHRFTKNTSKYSKSSRDKVNQDDEEPIDSRKLSQRRLTGIFPSPDEINGHYTDSSEDEHENPVHQKPPNKVIFQVEDIDDERRSPSPPPILTPPPPPILFITQVSNEDEEVDVEITDSWSAIQRHRNLTQEIKDQKEVSSPTEELYAVPKPDRSSKNQTEQPQSKPVGDMKRNNAMNDLLLDSEKDYPEK